MNITAWTGGPRPEKFLVISKEERRIRHVLFRNAMQTVFGYWGDYKGMNRSALDCARIHYTHARYDAHATMREKRKT